MIKFVECRVIDDKPATAKVRVEVATVKRHKPAQKPNSTFESIAAMYRIPAISQTSQLDTLA